MPKKKPAKPKKRLGRTYPEISEEVEKFIAVGEKVSKSFSAVERLIKGGVDHVLGPVIRQNMEERLAYLERENQALREVLMALVDVGGEVVVLAPTKQFALEVVRDRHNHIIVRRKT